MPVPYNKNFTTYKSTAIQGLDCQTTGTLTYSHFPGEDKTFAAYYTTVEAMEQGECIAMVRVPRGFTVTDALLTWTQTGVDAVIGVGDPFCCGRFLGPILMNRASGQLYIGADPQGTQQTCSTSIGRLSKIGRRGDGCGFGYTYQCDTDILITIGYGLDSFQQGGGSAAGTAAVSSGSAVTYNSGVVPSGTVFGLKIEGYINTAVTNPT